MVQTALATGPPLTPAGLWTARAPVCLTVQAARSVTPQILGGLAPLVLAGGALLCVDAGNCFDPCAFSVQARRRGVDPEAVLDRILVTRAFTIHQLEAVVQGELPPGPPADVPALIAVLGLDHLFLEETLPLWERRQVLGRTLARLRRLPEEGWMLLVTHGPPRGGAPWPRLIAQIGDWRATVSEQETRARARGRGGVGVEPTRESRFTIHGRG